MTFATKPAQGLAMLTRALDAGLPAKWVTADEAYGKDGKFRAALQRRHVGYVLAVACNQKIPTQTGSSRANTLAASAPDPAWKRRSCGDGVEGPPPLRLGRGIPARHRHRRTRLPPLAADPPQHHPPTELAYYLCYGPADTTDEEVIRVAGIRWAGEECFQTAKNEVGLDDYQVRRYDAWYRHITLAMWAHAFLAVTAAASKGAAIPNETDSFPSPSARSDVSWHTRSPSSATEIISGDGPGGGAATNIALELATTIADSEPESAAGVAATPGAQIVDLNVPSGAVGGR